MGVIRAGQTAPEFTPPRIAIQLANPVQEHLRAYITTNRATEPLEVVQPNVFTGKSLALCGAGPSLRDETIRGADEIWACNSALPYLVASGAKVTGGVGIDQTPGLLREWGDPPDVPYYVASSCDPYLIQHLQAKGRRVIFFHNHVGCDSDEGAEFDLYNETWPYMAMVGEGFSVVSRTIGLAQWMGFERVDVYGADCCFGPDDLAHANGDSAETAYHRPMLMEATMGDRHWRTRPDMLMDAVHLVRRARRASGVIRLMGDTLPVWLLGKPETFLDLVCRRLAPGELPPTDSSDLPGV